MTVLKSKNEIALMRQAGRVVASVLQAIKDEVKAGVSLKQLDKLAGKEVKKLGGRASFKGYRGFPANSCISVNNEIVHGIPNDRILEEGDIVSIDFGAVMKGYHGDAAITVAVGKIDDNARQLMDVTEQSLYKGIDAAHAGGHLGDISAAIQTYIETRGFSVIREYSGHGIGRKLHEDPLVPNFGAPGEGPLLKAGMTLALEPMVATGDWHTKVLDNNWTVVTADGGLSAHFEHTIAIHDGDVEILTVV